MGFWEKFFREKSLGLRLKSAPGSYFRKAFHRRCLTVFWICHGFWICEGSKYAKVLNILSRNIRKFHFLKIGGEERGGGGGGGEELFGENIRKLFRAAFFRGKFWGLRPKNKGGFFLRKYKKFFLEEKFEGCG